jgi:pimeloyl-ACP methyl ester carboxylesterase
MRPSFLPPMLRGPLAELGWPEAEIARVAGGTRSIVAWAEAWEREAERHVAAGDPWRACTAYWVGGRALLRPTPLRTRLYRRAIALYAVVPHAVALERFTLPCGDNVVVGYLQVPRRPGPRPLVLLVPGVLGVKEELHLYVEPMLARGVAVARIDLPGVGETTGRATLDAERLLLATLDHLGRDARLARRPVLAGLSLGGHFALRAAAERDVRGVAAVSTPFSMIPHHRRVPSHLWIGLRLMFGGASHDETTAIAAGLALDEHLPRVAAPALLAYGTRDAVVPLGEMDEIARRLGGPVRRVVYQGEGHTAPGAIADVAGRILELTLG